MECLERCCYGSPRSLIIICNSFDGCTLVISVHSFVISNIMKHFKTLADLHRSNGFAPPENPLFGIHHCTSEKACSLGGDREFTTDFYMIGFKKLRSGVI